MAKKSILNENFIERLEKTILIDWRKLFLVALILLGGCDLVGIPALSQKCLTSEPGDSSSFGSALAISGDYLAVGDPQANRVALYSRKANGHWSRTREILPPKASVAEKAGAGFGYALALNDELLIVGAYHERRKASNNALEYFGAVYSAKIGADGSVAIKEIPNPQTDLVVGYALSVFGNQVAFTGKTEVSPGRWIERVLVADPTNGQIVRVIGSPKRPEEKQTWFQLESPPSVVFDSFGSSLDGTADGSLLIGAIGAPPWGGAYLATADGKVEKIVFDQEKGLYPSSWAGSSVVLADDWIGIGRVVGVGISDTLLLRRSAQGWSLIGAAKLSGPLDATKSHISISAGRAQGMPATPTTRPDHLWVRVDVDKLVVESEIRWRRNHGFPIETNGVIDSEELILSAQGRVVRIGVPNTSTYVIGNCLH